MYTVELKGWKPIMAAAIMATLSILALSAVLTDSDYVSAESADIDSVQGLSDAIFGASADLEIHLTDNFVDDLESNGGQNIAFNHGYNITISGDDKVLNVPAGYSHFIISNSGTGVAKFENITFANDATSLNTGGLMLNGGKYEFVNCTFSHLTKAAVSFGGNQNDASFTDCTFKNNSSRAVFLA